MSSNSISPSSSQSSSDTVPPEENKTVKSKRQMNTAGEVNDAYRAGIVKSPPGVFPRSGEKDNKEEDNMKRRTAGPEIYFKFESQAVKLDQELRKLCNKARKLGSSASILSATTRLREGLNRVLHGFQNNAKYLYPQKIEAHIMRKPSPLEPIRRGKADPTLAYKQKLSITSADPKAVSGVLKEELRQFSEDVKNLLDCFRQFPEFVDELPDPAIAHRLEDFATLLEGYEEDSDPLAIRYFLDHTMGEMGDYLGSLAEQFTPFTTIGISTVKASQDHGISNLENQTVVATLFAGIATAMLQVYSDVSPGTLNTTLVVMWYMCLIFSIGSAVNGLLALSWKQAIYRSPDSHIPWWIRIWIKTFPLAFLVLAVACSFVAIILIGCLPDQSRATLIVTTVLSAISCLGLLAVSGWFISELLVFYHYKGRVWLVDIPFRRKIGFVTSRWWRDVRQLSSGQQGDGKNTGQRIGLSFEFRFGEPIDFWISEDKRTMSVQEIAKYRWHEGVRRIIQEIRYQKGQPLALSALSPRFSHLANLPSSPLRHKVAERLQSFKIAFRHPASQHHSAMVRSLRFSPNGEHLFTSNLRLTDPLSHLFQIGPSVSHEMELDFGYSPQIVWSRDSKQILVSTNRQLTVWKMSENNQPEKIIKYMSPYDSKEEHHIKSAVWNGDASGFFFVRGNKIMTVKLDKLKPAVREQETVLQPHDVEEVDFKAHLHHREIRSIRVTSDSRWMICVVGSLKEGDKPEKTTKRYGITIWDLNNQVVNPRETAIHHKISSIAIAWDDRSILISYENRSPSRYLYLDIDKNGTRLSAKQTYYVLGSDFAALPSIFGGERDHLVLRATQDGQIYVWDRDSAEVLHCISPQPAMIGKEITAIAWNRGLVRDNGGMDNYMFATGTHDGEVQIWQAETETSGEAAVEAATSENTAIATEHEAPECFGAVPTARKSWETAPYFFLM